MFRTTSSRALLQTESLLGRSDCMTELTGSTPPVFAALDRSWQTDGLVVFVVVIDGGDGSGGG